MPPFLSFLVSLIPIVFLGTGYLIGTWVERRHFRALDRREALLEDLIVTDLKRVPHPDQVEHSELVMGEAVIGCDYFKSFASQLRKLVGGRVRSLETLTMRARREATVRMLEAARRLGATEVHNVRLETSNVMTRRRNNQPSIAAEMFAFGTAIIRKSH